MLAPDKTHFVDVFRQNLSHVPIVRKARARTDVAGHREDTK